MMSANHKLIDDDEDNKQTIILVAPTLPTPSFKMPSRSVSPGNANAVQMKWDRVVSLYFRPKG